MFARVRALGHRIRNEIGVYQRILRHPRTPRRARWLLGLAVGYALSPIDLIPDWIPVVGYLDDALLIPVLVWLALRQVPNDVVAECRRTN